MRLLSFLALLLVVACGPVDELRERLRGPTPHADYVEALRAAGLIESAVARDWIAAGTRALGDALSGSVPFEERGYLDALRPEAVSIRVSLDRGQRVTITADLQPDVRAQLFVDVFRVPADSGAVPTHVAAADSGARALEFEPSRSADYVIRVQPELLRGGSYSISVRSEPTLSFPVEGVGMGAIGSRFGMPRDGGARSHHGVDIFAPRGTPVLAATDGMVDRVRETPRGGKVVWLRDSRRSQSLYYAHLDSQHVSNGTRVRVGDTLGFVGNTGNARTTPPHLHFGVYSRGPVDPFHFLNRPRTRAAALAVDTAWFGDTIRTRRDRLVARVIGGSGTRVRAVLPDMSMRWLDATDAERVVTASARTAVSEGCAVLDAPRDDAAVIRRVRSSGDAEVLGSFAEHQLVRVESVTGWIRCS